MIQVTTQLVASQGSSSANFGDIMVLVYQEISEDYMIKEARDSMGRTPQRLSYHLAKFRGYGYIVVVKI